MIIYEFVDLLLRLAGWLVLAPIDICYDELTINVPKLTLELKLVSVYNAVRMGVCCCQKIIIRAIKGVEMLLVFFYAFAELNLLELLIVIKTADISTLFLRVYKPRKIEF